MENLQELFSLYLHSNLRTFLNSSDILLQARNHFQDYKSKANLQKNRKEVLFLIWKEIQQIYLDQFTVEQTSSENPQLFSKEQYKTKFSGESVNSLS